ncbi:MAG: TlpA family protein disulfide reductase [Gammaproteobacteria bacterium HGW-Gammaproteobacteria-1]|jgi:thiol-disulfide isomerase/thioredoxin|nr:MAG: TlpA family protein disulfide reductase [Gammaproteobacteria bacterium HGW-Gammaproteobacteria-1]
MRRLTLPVLALLCSFAAAPAAAVTSGSAAPDFVLKSAAGSNVRLSEMRGQVVMINFWASWCGPCRQEMPLLEKLQQRYARLGFVMLGVNVEEQSQAAQKFLKDVPVSFPILWDTSNSVSRLYAVKAMPTSVIVDRDGKVRYIHPGYKAGDENTYSDTVRALLRE